MLAAPEDALVVRLKLFVKVRLAVPPDVTVPVKPPCWTLMSLRVLPLIALNDIVPADVADKLPAPVTVKPVLLLRARLPP